ncbi:hypothetical protein FB451DRAFT_1182535 [Mycena latifolia]|nr:hypothetical protein FB451DRAFT_1182535 [Mycena latifolia]
MGLLVTHAQASDGLKVVRRPPATLQSTPKITCRTMPLQAGWLFSDIDLDLARGRAAGAHRYVSGKRIAREKGASPENNLRAALGSADLGLWTCEEFGHSDTGPSRGKTNIEISADGRSARGMTIRIRRKERRKERRRQGQDRAYHEGGASSMRCLRAGARKKRGGAARRIGSNNSTLSAGRQAIYPYRGISVSQNGRAKQRKGGASRRREDKVTLTKTLYVKWNVTRYAHRLMLAGIAGGCHRYCHPPCPSNHPICTVGNTSL